MERVEEEEEEEEKRIGAKEMLVKKSCSKQVCNLLECPLSTVSYKFQQPSKRLLSLFLSI